MKKKVAILYLNTGGGHIGYAKALEKGIHRKYPQSEVVLFNPLTNKFLLKEFIEEGYSLTMKNEYTGSVFDLICKIEESQTLRKGSVKIVATVLTKVFEEFFEKNDFDLVVSTHFLLNKPVVDIFSKKKRPPLFFNLVADPLSPHPIWCEVKDCQYIVESEKARNFCVEHGVPVENIHTFSMILDERFNAQLSEKEKSEFKLSLSISAEQKCVFLMGGGEGIPNGEKIISTLLAYPFLSKDMQFLVVCGKNQQLAETLTQMVESSPMAENFKIFGYSNQVFELMNIADVVLCKSGPATVFETLSQGKPMIIYKMFGPQEKGNAEYVVEHGCGIYEPRIEFLPGLIDGLLLSDEVRNEMVKKIKKLRYQNGLDAVIEFIFSY